MASLLAAGLAFTSSCRSDKAGASVATGKDRKEAKAMLQGMWVDSETESPVFKVEGDSIFYPDNTGQPTTFSIIGDTLVLGSTNLHYPIVKQTRNVFWFKNPTGEMVKLARNDDQATKLSFMNSEPQAKLPGEVLKKDTVVVYNGQRYHCYVAINPTKYKVIRKTFNDDGVVVTNVYYDNIIHLSIFQGTQKLYSRDFRKAMFADFVPERFLSQSVLTNMDYSSVDDEGFHFNVMLCIPDVASCYLLDANVSLAGEMSLEVKEY